jgi:phosphoglycolate phosphatase
LTLLLFDVDGTLVDSQDILVETQRRTFAAHGLPSPSRERSLSIVGLSLVEAFAVLTGDASLAPGMADTYRAQFQDVRADPAFAEPLFPGADEVLRALAARPRTRLGICTGKSRRGVDRLLAEHGWAEFFSTVQTADDAPSKPHPAMIIQAMAQTGASPERTLMIGDSTFDMAMAQAAGVRAIAVDWGYHDVPALRAAGADAIVSRMEDLLRTNELVTQARREFYS